MTSATEAHTDFADSAESASVPVFFHIAPVLKNALTIALVGAGVVVLGQLLAPDSVAAYVLLFAASCCLLFALCRALAGWKWHAYFKGGASARPYLRFDRPALRLLDSLDVPWSAIGYMKISRLAWPRRTYLLVGVNAFEALRKSVPAALTADNMLIALALREATGAVLEPDSFLALCIEAAWSPLAPVALTHGARAIAELAEQFFHAEPAAFDREGAAQLFPLAQAAYQRGDLGEADLICQRVLAMDGTHNEAMFMQSLIALAGGALRDAEIHLRRALAQHEHPAYAGNLGLLLYDTGRREEAETWLRRALDLAPKDVNTMYNLANLTKDEGRLDEAEALYLEIIGLDPEGTPALNNLGLLYWKAGRLDEAAQQFQRALTLDPSLADAHGNLGIVQKEQGRFAEAEASYRRALALRPDAVGMHGNLGLLFQETNRQQEAQEAFERALAIQPGHSLSRYNLSLTQLALGDYARGLPGLEARYDPASPDSPVTLPALPFPQWNGEDLTGKTLVVWPEQGFGDYIQFARYFPLLKARGLARLTLCCSGVIAPLLQTAAGVDAVVSEQEELADHDYWAFPLSLALHAATRIDAIPSSLPYLHALPERIERWRPELQGAKRRIGLVWKGAAGHKNDANRSLPSLATLAPLWDAADVSFFSLQKGQGEAEAASPPPGQPLRALGGKIADLADTAAIVAQLDLVICVDTAIAHVAGSLGKPCWVLLPAVGCDWRWHLERADSPWYPGVMRLFRQRAAGDWGAVVQDMARALADGR